MTSGTEGVPRKTKDKWRLGGRDGTGSTTPTPSPSVPLRIKGRDFETTGVVTRRRRRDLTTHSGTTTERRVPETVPSSVEELRGTTITPSS